MKSSPFILALFAASAMGADVVLFRTTDTITWAGTGADRVATFGAADVTSGLIARWLMAEGTGTAVADTGGTNTAYFVNDPAWTNRTGRGAIYFDGVNDAIRSSTVNLSSTNVITLCFWMNWKTYANDNDMAIEYTATINAYAGFYVIPNSGAPNAGKWAAVMSSPGGLYNGVTIDRPTSNTWYHFAVVLNRVSGVTCYKDGILCATTPAFTNTLSGNFSAASIGLNFMSRNGASLFGNGKLQDVRIYNRGLTASEASAIWNATK